LERQLKKSLPAFAKSAKGGRYETFREQAAVAKSPARARRWRRAARARHSESAAADEESLFSRA